MESVFEAIDQIIARVNKYGVEPGFSKERNRREGKKIDDIPSSQELLRACAEIIVYSQNANSERVSHVIEKGALASAFLNFEVEKVAKLNPLDVVDDNWEKGLSGIRQETKVYQIIKVARILWKTPGILNALNKNELPRTVLGQNDIESFWKGFKALKTQIKNNKVPFVQSTTTLLHLLMHLGYDCAKPDLIVMEVAKNLGIVEDVKKDESLRKTVSTIQAYAATRKVRPPVVDFYLLIEGGQAEVRKYVRPEFYGLPRLAMA